MNLLGNTIHRRWALIGIAVIVVVGAVAWFGRDGGDAEKKRARPAISVIAAAAAAQSIPIQIKTFGRVQAIASVNVKTRIDGVIDKVFVREGQDVKVGDTLIKLDDRLLKSQLAQSEGALMRDEAQLEVAHQNLTRGLALRDRDFIAKSQIDVLESNMKALEGSVAADKAQVESARVQLSYASIDAAIAGRVGSVALKDGNAVRAADTAPLLTINQLKPIFVSFSIPQAQFPELQTAMTAGPVSVAVNHAEQKNEVEAGKLDFLENAVDLNTNTVGAKASLKNEKTTLWPGEFVDVAVTLRVEPHAIVVPAEAVQVGQQGSYVLLIGNNDVLALRPVSVSRTVDGLAVIEKGLAEGDRIVTSGQLSLEPGNKVAVKKPIAQSGHEEQ